VPLLSESTPTKIRDTRPCPFNGAFLPFIQYDVTGYQQAKGTFSDDLLYFPRTDDRCPS
jgi:hypothetical protein